MKGKGLVLKGLIAALAGCLIFGAIAGTAGAATITVNTTNDELDASAPCSLREAISSVNSGASTGGCVANGGYAGTDTVLVPAGVYALTIGGAAPEEANTRGDLDVTANLEMRRIGTRPATIDASGLVTPDRVIHIDAAAATISGFTFRGGDTTQNGGGIGIFNGSSLTLSNSTVTGNSAELAGGGIGAGGELIATNVTVSGNKADSNGGGVNAQAMPGVTLTSSTVTANTADADNNGGDGGGLARGAGAATMKATLLAGNTDVSGGGPDCTGPVVSGGNNLFSTTPGCGMTPGPSDVSSDDSRLGPLADNGGPTATHALLAGSDAVNQVEAGCPATDQRGVPRTLGGRCDIGAYERVRCRGVVVNRVGTPGKDKLVGTGNADGLLGLGGKDVLRGLGGNDGLCGGGGRDRLIGGAGRDKLAGQAGRDRCIGGAGLDRGAGCERRLKIP